MYRRDFIKSLIALSAVSALPVWSRNLIAQTLSANSSAPVLAIPSLLRPDAQGNILLTLQQGTTQWRSGPVSNTWGVNGPLLGPAIAVKRGEKVNIQVRNQLTEPCILHWHGVEVPGESDGGPHNTIAVGKSWHTSFTVDQPAATCWFHPHTHRRTAYQVAMGLGGLFLLEDQQSQTAKLPSTWGEDDIPLILQDKRLDSRNQIDHQIDVITAAVGWFGDIMLTNGAIYPSHIAPQGWLRLRCLNACNARALHLATSDNRTLYVIASDGGFLAEPVPMKSLEMLPGERFEILLEVTGTPFDLLTLPVEQMGMTLAPFHQPLPILRINSTGNSGNGTLVEQLVTLPALPTLTSIPERHLQLSMDPRLDMQGMMALQRKYGKTAMAGMSMHDMHNSMHGNGQGMQQGMMQGRRGPLDIANANAINGAPFNFHRSAFHVKQGQWEKWVISGEGDMMLHPFHIHGTQFRIVQENGESPERHRQGWKDIVKVEGDVSEVLVRFNHPATEQHPFMAHCHLLEHEDTGMMLSFTVGK
ncbi:MAG: multicopper oxidase CueO [Enterobacteriaceae bacterium]